MSEFTLADVSNLSALLLKAQTAFSDIALFVHGSGDITVSSGSTSQSIPSLTKLRTQMLKGDTGPQGIQGIQGIQGVKGDRGDTGLQGLQGIQGVKGDAGAQGIQGLKGDTGAQGIQGLKGDKGDKGDTGPQGPAGSVNSVQISDVTGLQTALNAKAPTAGPTFTGTATFNGVNAATVLLNTGLLYPDGNHTLLKTGASGSEKYWRWDANGTLYALSGGLDAAGDLRTGSKLIVGPSDGAANSTTMGPGYMEMRSQAFGAYIDLSNANSTAMDFGGRLQYAGSNLTISNGAGGNIVIGSGNVFANSSDGAQAGRVLTQDGSEQIVTKNVAYQNAGNDDFNVAPAAGLEVRGKGGNTAAMMRFHRPGAFGAQLGLGTDNHLRWGGWSEGTVSYRVLTEKWAPISIESDSGKLLMRDGSGWASAHGVRTQPGDGNGIRFWNNDDSYSISMGSSSWGGRIWEGTSDYNMYFKMTGGTNRGFNFKNGNTVVAGIDGSGTLRLNGSLEAAGEVYCSNWFRVRGPSQGIYWEQFGGGWQMYDGDYLRSYNGKNIYTAGFMQANNVKLGYGVDVGVYSDVNNMAYRTPHAQGTHFFQGNAGQSTYCIMGDGSINMYRSMWMNGGWVTFNSRGLNNGLRFQQNSERDLRFIQKAENWLHWTNESDGFEIAGLDCWGNFNTRSSITSPSVTATSDARLKHDIVALDGALELVSRIKPSRFRWNEDDRKDIGVIAQELEDVAPELVRTDHQGMKSVNYNGLTVINTAAIQDMRQEIHQMRADIAALRARLH